MARRRNNHHKHEYEVTVTIYESIGGDIGNVWERKYIRSVTNSMGKERFEAWALGDVLQIINTGNCGNVERRVSLTRRPIYWSVEGRDLIPDEDLIVDEDKFDKDEYEAKYDEYEKQRNSFPVQEGRWS